MFSTIVTARLARRQSADGIFEAADHVPLGKLYTIDLARLRVANGYNIPQQRAWEHRWMVWDVRGGWLPVELLDVLP